MCFLYTDDEWLVAGDEDLELMQVFKISIRVSLEAKDAHGEEI